MDVSVKRAREFHDLIERYIETRRRAFVPRVQTMATEAGLSDRALLFLGYLRQIRDGDRVTVAALRRRLAYSTKHTWLQRWDELIRRGLAEPMDEGWRLTRSGLELMDRFWAANREHQASLPLPAEPLHRVVMAVEAITERLKADPYDRVALLRRLAPDDRLAQPEAVRLEFAIFELAVSLDDGHIHAWQQAGYEGPVLDVLTRAWSGTTTRAELLAALALGQEPEDVDRNIEALVRRGDLAREGDRIELTAQGRAARDRIEAETDRLGLAHWPTGEALEALMSDLHRLVAALPPEEDLPEGPTH